MSRTLTGWNFWGTPGSPRTEAPGGNQRLAKTRSSAEPLRVRAEVPSVTRKRAFLNHAVLLLTLAPCNINACRELEFGERFRLGIVPNRARCSLTLSVMYMLSLLRTKSH